LIYTCNNIELLAQWVLKSIFAFILFQILYFCSVSQMDMNYHRLMIQNRSSNEVLHFITIVTTILNVDYIPIWIVPWINVFAILVSNGIIMSWDAWKSVSFILINVQISILIDIAVQVIKYIFKFRRTFFHHNLNIICAEKINEI